MTFLRSFSFSFGVKSGSPCCSMISHNSNISLNTNWLALKLLASDLEPFAGLNENIVNLRQIEAK